MLFLIEQMKVMVNTQQDQMRAHFLALQQEYHKVESLKDSLQSRLETSETEVTDIRRQLQQKQVEVQVRLKIIELLEFHT